MTEHSVLLRHSFDNNLMNGSQNPLQQRRAVVQSFNRARMRGTWRGRLSRLMGRSTQLQSFNSTGQYIANQVSADVQYIALDDVTGSEGRSRDFDNHFWPLKDHNRDRWVNIALAIRNGKPLPPIKLIHTAEGYAVRDGHHRLSVARAFGQAVIEAEIA
jgi:hypothetical protein